MALMSLMPLMAMKAELVGNLDLDDLIKKKARNKPMV